MADIAHPSSLPPASETAAGSVAPLHWVKPPQQARSQRTLERMLDAAEELIIERGASALTVSELVRRAGSSVGAFYARFPDKDAILATLHERSCSEALATAELALDPARWKQENVERVILELTRFTETLCRQRLGLLLAFISLAAADTTYAKRRAALEAQIADRLHHLFESRRDEIGHPDLRTAANISVRMIFGALEYGAIIHRPSSETKALGIAPELCRAIMGYLGTKPKITRSSTN